MEENKLVKTELHIHSTYSDGEETPEEIIYHAKRANISLLAFTDHDEIEAYNVARPLADQLNIQLIPGIELNTDGEDGELHILGYFFDVNHPKMLEHISWRKNERKNWAEEIIAKLNRMDYRITLSDVLEHASGEIVVRTHIAKALKQKGYFDDAQTAYEELLVKGKPAFQARAPFSAQDAIRLIHECGGSAFLAHPGTYNFQVHAEKLLSYGLDGIEVYHSKHSKKDILNWKEFAQQHQLLISGGSDSHGAHSRNPFPIGSVQLEEGEKRWWLQKAEEKK